MVCSLGCDARPRRGRVGGEAASNVSKGFVGMESAQGVHAQPSRHVSVRGHRVGVNTQHFIQRAINGHTIKPHCTSPHPPTRAHQQHNSSTLASGRFPSPYASRRFAEHTRMRTPLATIYCTATRLTAGIRMVFARVFLSSCTHNTHECARFCQPHRKTLCILPAVGTILNVCRRLVECAESGAFIHSPMHSHAHALNTQCHNGSRRIMRPTCNVHLTRAFSLSFASPTGRRRGQRSQDGRWRSSHHHVFSLQQRPLTARV